MITATNPEEKIEQRGPFRALIGEPRRAQQAEQRHHQGNFEQADITAIHGQPVGARGHPGGQGRKQHLPRRISGNVIQQPGKNPGQEPDQADRPKDPIPQMSAAGVPQQPRGGQPRRSTQSTPFPTARMTTSPTFAPRPGVVTCRPDHRVSRDLTSW